MDFDIEDVPELEGKVSLPVAGEVLEVSRQRIFQMAREERKLPSLRKIRGTGARPAAYVVDTIEVLRLRVLQCGQCQDAIAGGAPVPYCTHTDLEVPAAVA
jgi:hypothetical protein